ncbi:MAG TPA: HD domain-containing protein [bacterium]|jgi:3'-5' exoribonuclease|nr:HD domain-containing protein [Candidatus Omnitrophota bacterium]HOJ60542.1 HD domain-containing protein [bacterium]HOL94810.1 HD domain-containing protein [bacterium]HPP01857.1 HD domain-containing protein [bacterium]HXK94107.1 HD domain-containing protein [bacterium]
MHADANEALPLPPKVWVRDLKAGGKVQSLFQVTRIYLRDYEKGKFLSVRLGDKTGKISAILWDNAEEAYQTIREGDVVRVNCRVGHYKGEIQATLSSIQKVEDLSAINPSDFIPASAVPVEHLVEKFDELITSLNDADYRALLQEFRNDEALWARFQSAPAAKRWHHPYLHGLLEHTLFVVKLCRLIAPLYPEVNIDLLVTGAVFHDCGKMEELSYDSYIDYSTDGRLLGHLYIGAMIVDRLIHRLPTFPAAKRQQILHIILSHHGEVERSPVLPMTLEACLFHFIDNMDAQMAAVRREMNAVREENREWTGYVNLLNRFLYLGENPSREENNEEPQ